MQGFDYRPGVERKRDQSPKNWAAEGQAVLKEGGFRRVEHGETFFHNKDGRIAFEVYGNVKVHE